MTGAEFATRAERCEGAPFRLGGRDPATGLDCVGLVAAALGPHVSAPSGYGLRNAAIAHHLAFAARAGFVPTTLPAERGDLILVAPGPAQHHLLVVLARDEFLHAHAGLRRVVRHRGALPWPVLARWRLPTSKE